jgi:DNA-binding NtrC family response regulator
LQIQPRFLKVLEEKRFRRVGAVRDRRVDVRLIASTHQDLALAVREGRFRSDLYFRISTIPLVLPPLRQRPEDIATLARHFLQRFALELGRAEMHLTDEAELSFREYPWPGNIRELRNVIERAVLLSRRDTLTREDLRFDAPLGPAVVADESNLTLNEVERRHIERVLRQEGGHVDRTAKRLGVPRSTLYQKLKQYGIQQFAG